MTFLTFFTKILSRSAQWRSCFAFTFACEREAGLNINKVCDFVMNEKNNIFISCVFNGFKYSKTCLGRPPLGRTKCGLSRQVVSEARESR